MFPHKRHFLDRIRIKGHALNHAKTHVINVECAVDV